MKEILFCNFRNIDKYIKPSEHGLFRKYLEIIFDYGAENELERLYAGDTVEGSSFFKFAQGTKTEVDGEEVGKLKKEIKDYRKKIETCKNEERFLAIFHNHPNSRPPSYGDYDIFFRYELHGKDIAVCGHNGNLFFIQKSDDFMRMSKEHHDAMQTRVMKICWDVYAKTLTNSGIGNTEELKDIDREALAKLDCIAQELIFDFLCDEPIEHLRFVAERADSHDHV